MIYAKTNPVGVDAQILRYQKWLYTAFDEHADIDVYGRLYINDKQKVKVAEAYIGDGEYKEVFADDKRALVMGFIVNGTRDGLNNVKANVELIVSANLSKLYDTPERMDEELLLKVASVIKQRTLAPQEKNIKTDFNDVFAKLNPERYKARNMHPYFNFSISFDVNYK